MEPNEVADNCLAGGMVAKVTDGKIPLVLANLSNHHVRIDSGWDFGNIRKVDLLEAAPAETLSPQVPSLPASWQVYSDNPFPSLDDEIRLQVRELLPEHLSQHFFSWCVDLTLEQAWRMCHLLIEFADSFSKGDDDLGHYTGIQHEIILTDNKPIKHPLRRTPIHFQEEEEAHLKLLQDLDVIRPSVSPYCSSPVLVRKKDGGVRWCLDYRDLNTITKKDVFPLPKISECIDRLAGNTLYSCIDLAMGYFQISVKPEHRQYTAFNTRFGLFEHNRMSFGLCNAPATFQRAMNEILRGLLWSNVLCYLDDCIIMAKGFDDMLVHLREVFHRFKIHNLKMKAKKCDFFKREVKFLGWLVDQEGVRPDPAKVKVVQEWPQPTSVKQLQAFLGLANYHRNHIPKYSFIAAPLYELTKKDIKEFRWTADADLAFLTLKEKLVSAPVLGFPMPGKTFVLDTDASDISIGCELSQMDTDEEGKLMEDTAVVIEYNSLSLSAAERRYCVTRRELLAVVKFTQQYRHYLLGRRFVVRTDHNALRWLFGFKEPENQLARWMEQLVQYDMEIVYRRGTAHVNADALSRRPGLYPFCYGYAGHVPLEDLPCMRGAEPCGFCTSKHRDWERFYEDVDYVVPLTARLGDVLAVRSVVLDLEAADCRKITLGEFNAVESIGRYLESLLIGVGCDVGEEDPIGLPFVRYLDPDLDETVAYDHDVDDLDATLPYADGHPVVGGDANELDATLPYADGHPVVEESRKDTAPSRADVSSGTPAPLANDDTPSLDGHIGSPVVADPGAPPREDEASEVDIDSEETEQVMIKWKTSFTVGELRKEQLKDKDLNRLHSWLERDPSPTEISHQGKSLKLLWRKRDLLNLKDGVLYLRVPSLVGDRLAYIVPYQLRDLAMRTCHEALCAGHFGVTRTLALLRMSFYWPSMILDTELFVGSCGSCTRNKKSKRTPRAALSAYHAGYPMERVHIDLVGKLATTTRGNQWILVVVDQFTKFVEAYPLVDADAETIAETLVTRFFSWLGYPLYIHSDQGANFTGKVFSAVCRLVGSVKTRTTAYHPSANGQVERYNRTLVEQIRCYKDSHNIEWDELCPFVTQNLRGTPTDRTGISPNLLMFGRETLGPPGILFGLPEPLSESPDPAYVRKLRDRIQVASDAHREKLGHAIHRWKLGYDTRANPVPYSVGDFVYMVNTKPCVGRGQKKFQPLYAGPFLVIEVKSPSVLKIASYKKEHVVSHDRIIPCHDRDMPLWIKRKRHFLLNPVYTIVSQLFATKT